MVNPKIIKNKYGYYELEIKPSNEELKEYYKKKYYQENKGSYQNSYSREELQYIHNKIEERNYIIEKLFDPDLRMRSLLDVGCGEGWALRYFHNKGFEVEGLDYSDFGIQAHNPEMAAYVKVGDIYENLTGIIQQKRVYTIVWLDNILEHVLNPVKLLQQLYAVVENKGVLVIEVPNDFSFLQEYLYQHSLLKEKYWVVVPDHISYFNADSLKKIGELSGFTCKEMIADFPVDLFLFNENTNYYENRSVGKSVHNSMIMIDTLLHETGIGQKMDLYASLARAGLGRQIIGFFVR